MFKRMKPGGVACPKAVPLDIKAELAGQAFQDGKNQNVQAGRTFVTRDVVISWRGVTRFGYVTRKKTACWIRQLQSA